MMVTSATPDSSATVRRRWQWKIPSLSSTSTSSFQQDDGKPHWPLPQSPTSKPAENSCPVVASGENRSLLKLPLEIVIHHLMPHLDYPSLLALRLSHPRFYHSPLLYPSRDAAMQLRLVWLLARAGGATRWARYQSGSVDLRTDHAFLAHEKVQEMVRVDWNKRNSSYLSCGLGTIWYSQSNPFNRERVLEVLQSIRQLMFGVVLALVVIAFAVAAVLSSMISLTRALFHD